MADLLLAEALTAGYGDSIVLENVEVRLAPGESLALLGRNGVGKTTLLKSLMGLIPIKTGAIEFDNKPIQNATPFERARALVLHPSYAFIEVYPDTVRAIGLDGTVSVIG